MTPNCHGSVDWLRWYRDVGRSRWFVASLALWSLDACSLKDMSYLSKGSSSKGGDSHSGGSAGDTSQQGGGGAEAGATSGGDGFGGSSESGGSGGVAGTACDSGLTYCTEASACINLSIGKTSGSTVDDCGTCGNTCSLTNAAAATCSSATCTPTCSNGFGDCNAATANDGCETNTSTTAGACGKCGRVCSDAGASARVCTESLCKPTCLPKFADCTLDSGSGTDDGCESFLDALAHCGTTCANVVACSPAQVCNSGVCGAAQGVVELSMPLTAADQGQRYADTFSNRPNLTSATLTLRLYAPGATKGLLNLYVGDADFTGSSNGTQVQLSTLSSGWSDVVVSVGIAAGTYDPVNISQLNIEITTGGTGPWTNPTLIYIDRIWSSNGLVNDTFDTEADFVSKIVSSSNMKIDGSDKKWFTAVP